MSPAVGFPGMEQKDRGLLKSAEYDGSNKTTDFLQSADKESCKVASFLSQLARKEEIRMRVS